MPDQTTTPLSPADQLDLLADAISDIGYWSWWTADLPDALQLEVGGTQLYFPPTSADKLPQTQIALQLRQPTSVSFLSWRVVAIAARRPTRSARLKSLLDKATHCKVVHVYEFEFAQKAFANLCAEKINSWLLLGNPSVDSRNKVT